MKQRCFLLFACICLLFAAGEIRAQNLLSPFPAEGTLQTAFAPWDDIEDLIVDAIGMARKQVLVQAYLLTSKKITRSLIDARRRDVDVEVLLDAKQLVKARSSKATELRAGGIPIWLETSYENAHNKVIVIDAGTRDAAVITGSYNFTWTAQHKNAENVLIARSNPSLAARYAMNWEWHRRQARPYGR
jgi:phosphatidylserine/phosphatidylglycerophosphate/cardiolipin synthase-like enzyme